MARREDCRRVSRERATLLRERILHKNRRECLEELRTGDGRSLPTHVKAEILREIDRLELVLRQIGEVEAERDEILRPAEASSPAALLMRLKGIGAEFAPCSTLRVCSGTSRTDGSWQPMQAWLPAHGRVVASTTSRVSRRQAIHVCARQWSSLPGCG